MQAFQLYDNERVTTIGIFNSGEVTVTGKPAKVTKPIFYVLGGSADIAYTNVSLHVFLTLLTNILVSNHPVFSNLTFVGMH